MTDEQNYNVEELQEQYYQALESKDQDKIKAAQDKIESALSGEVREETEQEVENTSAEVSHEEHETVVDSSKEEEPDKEVRTNEQEATQQQQQEQRTKDWLESLDPEIRKNVEKIIQDNRNLQHRMKSDEGRVAAYQRRYSELQQIATRQEELLKELRGTGQQKAKPQSSQSAAPKNNLNIEDDPDLKEIAKDDPQLANLILKREAALKDQLESQRREFEDLRNTIGPLQQYQQEYQTKSELNRLQTMIPNAVEIFNYRDPDSGISYWDDWVQRQPKLIREAALSDNADEVAQALRLHIADMQAYFGFNTAPQQNEEAVTKKPQVDPGKVANVQRERERKLQVAPIQQSGVSPAQQTKPTMQQILNDPELLRKEQERIFKEELKKLGIA